MEMSDGLVHSISDQDSLLSSASEDRSGHSKKWAVYLIINLLMFLLKNRFSMTGATRRRFDNLDSTQDALSAEDGRSISCPCIFGRGSSFKSGISGSLIGLNWDSVENKVKEPNIVSLEPLFLP